MSLARKVNNSAPLDDTYLPDVLRNVNALKSLSKRILKLYIVKRKPDWDSYLGKTKGYLKMLAAAVSFGKMGSAELDTWRIVDQCDQIKREIDSANIYPDYFKLIEKLHADAIKAKSEEIYGLSNPSLRADTYYAILALMQEIIKLEFPQDYQADIDQTVARLNSAKLNKEKRFWGNLDIKQDDVTINDCLKRLVLLGNRKYYNEAFVNRNIFKGFQPIDGKSSKYITEADANLYKGCILLQMRQDANCKHNNLTHFVAPNIHIPYQFQPHYALLYLKNVHNEGLRTCTSLALKDTSISTEKSFRTLYVEEPTTFAPTDSPADMNEILGENSEEFDVMGGDDNNNNNQPFSQSPNRVVAEKEHQEISPSEDASLNEESHEELQAHQLDSVEKSPSPKALSKAQHATTFSPPPEHKMPADDIDIELELSEDAVSSEEELDEVVDNNNNSNEASPPRRSARLEKKSTPPANTGSTRRSNRRRNRK